MNRYGTALVSTGRRVASGSRTANPSLDLALNGAVLGALLLTAASFLARASWILELLTHFRYQLALGSMVLLLWALARRRLVTAALAGMAAAANAVPLMPYVLAGTPEANAAAPYLRVMAANVHYRNEDYAALLGEVQRRDPHVLGVMEVDQAWLDALSSLESKYRFAVLLPEEGAYGLALYSKLPLTRLAEYSEAGLQTAVTVEVDVAGSPVTLVLAHVRAPMGPARANLRNVQFDGLADMLRADGNSAKILLGDLNTTPWSPYYRELVSTTGMHNAALGQGYQPTWPAGFSLLKIPIDHCLVSDALRVEDFATGSDFGSDHLPIIVDLAVAGDASPSTAGT